MVDIKRKTIRMKKVIILQHRLLHYRTDLFEMIRESLSKQGITLDLIHGQASQTEAKRKDEAMLPWATKIKNSFLKIKGVDLIWQFLPSDVDQCDLLVVMQENRILSNYPHIVKRKLLGKKVAYWGHGKNLQSTKPIGLREIWKKKWLTSVDWWFAYTTSTVDYLLEQRFPAENITCLNNAIDINRFKEQLANIENSQLFDIKRALNIEEDALVGIFCGSLYAEKRLDLLLEAIDFIKVKVPSFYVVIIGDGPDANILHYAALTRPWLSLVGVKTGSEKALYYRLANVMLNPGLVGLHVLDSFGAGVPMITTSDALHSPEYDYLQNDVNGLVTPGDAKAYAEAIIDLLMDKDRLENMQQAALGDSDKYTVEAMAENFCQGIIKALNLETNK
jgi:glycosyltransferase involved in cell wall biosynthesis